MSEDIKIIETKPVEVKPVTRRKPATKIVTSETRLTEAANKNDIEEIHKTTSNPKQEYVRKMKEEVTGVFRNYENPGGTLKFSTRMFPNERTRKWTLIDGHTYSLPRGVVLHLSQNCAIPVHQAIVNEDGMARHEIRNLNYRFGFESTEFRNEDFRPKITRVETPKIIKPVFI